MYIKFTITELEDMLARSKCAAWGISTLVFTKEVPLQDDGGRSLPNQISIKVDLQPELKCDCDRCKFAWPPGMVIPEGQNIHCCQRKSKPEGTCEYFSKDLNVGQRKRFKDVHGFYEQPKWLKDFNKWCAEWLKTPVPMSVINALSGTECVGCQFAHPLRCRAVFPHCRRGHFLEVCGLNPEMTGKTYSEKSKVSMCAEEIKETADSILKDELTRRATKRHNLMLIAELAKLQEEHIQRYHEEKKETVKE